MHSLTTHEVGQIKQLYLGFKLLAAGVAKLYASPGGSTRWQETGLVGAWTFFVHERTKILYLQLLDIQTGTRFFTQELYEGFEYQRATPYFHTFESDDSVLGVSFASDQDAARFYTVVQETISKKEYHMRPSTLKKVWRTGLGSFTAWRSNKQQQRQEEKVLTISGPSGFKHESHIGFSDGQFGFWGQDPVAWLDHNPAWRTYFQSALNVGPDVVNANAGSLLSVAAAHHARRSLPPLPAQPQTPVDDHPHDDAATNSAPSEGLAAPDAQVAMNSEPAAAGQVSATCSDVTNQPCLPPPPPPLPQTPSASDKPPKPAPVALPAAPPEGDLVDVLRGWFDKKFSGARGGGEEEESEGESEYDPFADDAPFSFS